MGFSTRGTLAAPKFLATLALLSIAALPQTAQAQSLTTIYTGGNSLLASGGAVFFDLNVVSGITLTSIETSLVDAIGTAATINIYTRVGTFSGFTNTSVGWSLVSSGSGTAAGVNNPTSIDVTDFSLMGGVTGVAIHYSNVRPSYTNGNGSNQVYSNADLSLTAGASQNPLFGTNLNTPRVWNGTIFYTTSSAAPEPGTLALLALGVVGGVIARRRK